MSKKDKRKKKKEKYLKKNRCQHCGDIRTTKGIHQNTRQCFNCFTVVKGPESCLNCIPEFASKEFRLNRNCPLYRRETYLLHLLEKAEEHHCLTVVRLAIKDLKKGKPIISAHSRLRTDFDKMRGSQTEAGKNLYKYIEDNNFFCK